jgi:hypothetical protein
MVCSSQWVQWVDIDWHEPIYVIVLDFQRLRRREKQIPDAALDVRAFRAICRRAPRSNDRRRRMARKPATREEFVLFDVLYEDGTQRSNRRVPSEILGGLDGDAPARAVIEQQDRLIAEKSGKPPSAVKSIRRSRGK